ncbi:MFS transporter [Colwellia sp. MB02u-6]|uniref:MFS transporter n=1 Tax=Colwellia sp. MB02u-6 TaxID=2759824 RepID=UPI0015F4541A|nr:MFS transporter [Colwellia sp. MB02u-6]MBA6328315.1 MFS transporter [Colwellia sp. MB02u-6]
MNPTSNLTVDKSSIEDASITRIKLLTYMMFFVFAMTSDAVGVIIPQLIETYNLNLTQASAFHYIPMIFIAFSGLFLGYLADKWGRKLTIVIGLMIFSVACFMFSVGESFYYFLFLLALIGIAIGLFKTGALALIGDISSSGKEHTATMNKVEGFFGVGAIVGPAIVSYLLVSGVSWKYLYIAAGAICILLCLVAMKSKYPVTQQHVAEKINLKSSFKLMKDPYALGFSLAIALYVATEVAIYVWMPTLLADYTGSLVWLATYALTIFFVLRASGRFLGVWMLKHFSWQKVMFWFSLAVFLCYLGTALMGVDVAVVLLPLSGLFMSVIYPTLNSKGISCFQKSKHGAVAGVILFFTAVSAAISPLLMGIVSDLFGHVSYGFYLATFFAGLLFVAAIYNLKVDPTQHIKIN